MTIAILILWLNVKGEILAIASGTAASPQACEQIAAKRVEAEAGNPALAGTKAKVICLGVATAAPPRERPHVDGEISL